MKRIINHIIALGTLLAVSVSCETVFSEEEMPPQFVPHGKVIMDDEYRSISFDGNADSQEITFNANYDWKIITTQKWVKFSKNMGKAGDNTITISVDKSYEDVPREAQLTFVVERLRDEFTISQAKGNVMIPEKRSYDGLKRSEQKIEVEITYNEQFDIEVDYDGAEEWVKSVDGITHVETPELSTKMKLKLEMSDNTTYNTRTATFALVNEPLNVREEFTVVQEGKTPLQFGDYEYITVPAAALTEPAEVTINAAIDFEMSTSDDWIIPNNEGAVFDPDRLTYTFSYTTLAHEYKESTRTGYIFFTNEAEDVVRAITITQDEYNDDGFITVTAENQMVDKIAEMLAANSYVAAADYNRLYVTGKDVALSADDLVAIKTTLPNLKLVDISKTATTAIPNALYNANKKIEQFIFPSTIEVIGEIAFQYSGLTSVVIPGDSEKVSIAYRAFMCCDNLTSITLERGVVELGAQAFSTEKMLTYLFVPKTVTSWLTGEDGANKAFFGCTALKTATLEDGLSSLGIQSFASGGMEEIYLPGTIDFSLNLNAAAENKSFGSCFSLRKVEFGEGTKSVVGNPLVNCSKVEAVIMPEEVPVGETFGGSAGGNVAGGLTIYVPASSVEEYLISPWDDLYNIASIDDYVE